MKVVVGVDGGGTKTAIICLNSDTLEVLSEVRTGSSNQNSVGADKARDTLLDGIRRCLSDAGITDFTQVEALGLALSGVDRPEDEGRVKEWMAPLGISRIKVSSDAVAVVASGTSGVLRKAVGIISGTGQGALCMVSMPKESTGGLLAGGTLGSVGTDGSPLLGDVGSGYWIGQEALIAVVKAEDGRGPATALTEKVLTFLSVPTVQQLIPWIYKDGSQPWAKVAELAPLVSLSFQENDFLASDILSRAAEGLLGSVAAVVGNLGLEQEDFTLIMAGGNLTGEGSILTRLFKERLAQRFPKAHPVFPSVDMATACALMALKAK